MRKVVFTAALTLGLAATAAQAADLKPITKAPPPAPPPPSGWDVAFGGAVMSDYNFRGISQSNRKPSAFAYFEPRYNFNPNFQIYAGVSGYSITFPNNVGAEIDFYGGVRAMFDKLSVDFGVWYYYYPDGRTFNGATATACTNLPTPAAFAAGQCNIIKSDVSFVEVYGKLGYTFNDYWSVGAALYYAPDWLNTGADGTFLSGNVKYTGAALPNGIGWYVSAEVGHYWLGTTDAFYAFTPLPDYTAWNIGFGLTYKVFTLDLRYFDSDLSKGECNALTGDHTATFSTANIVPVVNPSGLGSKWCSGTFIVSLKADLVANKDLK